MLETAFHNSLYLVGIIIIWFTLLMALWLIFTFAFIIFSVMGEDYQLGRYRRKLERERLEEKGLSIYD